MSKRHRVPPVDLADYKAKKQVEGGIEILADGRVFVIPPIQCMTDEQFQQFQKARKDGGDLVAQARSMLDDYDAFVAAGGTALLLLSIVADHVRKVTAVQGVEPGESLASSLS